MLREVNPMGKYLEWSQRCRLQLDSVISEVNDTPKLINDMSLLVRAWQAGTSGSPIYYAAGEVRSETEIPTSAAKLIRIAVKRVGILLRLLLCGRNIMGHPKRKQFLFSIQMSNASPNLSNILDIVFIVKL